jgi:subtilisin-like proprotein convertase family protein
MKKADEGRLLTRGGEKVEIDKCEDSFTVNLSEPADKERLAKEAGVAAVEMLTDRVAKVKMTAEGDRTRVRDGMMDRLRQDRRLVVHHEYVEKNNPDVSYQITPEIILCFHPGTTRASMAQIIEAAGVVIKKAYPHLGLCYLVEVTDAAGANPVKVANRLEACDAVVFAEPCLINRFVTFDLPSDDQFPSQWHLFSKNASAPDIDPLADANISEAWQITKGSRDIVVAVLDDGFELSHPDFQGTGKVVHPVDFTGNDDQPLPGQGDYHGTPCAGVAIAEENGIGCVGVAPGCAFMPVRFPLGASDPWLIDIFQFVSQRAHIASCSWGMIPGNYPLATAVSLTFAELVRSGGKDGRGLVIVFAAGNYDAPLDATIDYPVRWFGRDASGVGRIFSATGRIINGYAAHPDTIAVSAITSLSKKALYSNWGRTISVTAPSNNFNPQEPWTLLPGRGITTTDNEYYGEDFTSGKRYTNSFGGTSSATPLVAGICALVKSANPGLSASEVKAIIEDSADKVEDASSDPLYGHAKGTYQNGHSEWFGYGKVNALRAVQAAAGGSQPSGVVVLENTTPLGIPDNFAAGVASVIGVSASGPVSGIELTVEITHSWIGDLEVSLIAPSGARAVLHNRSGGSADNLAKTYTVADTPALEALLGESAVGDWRLHIVDRAKADVGTLQRWALKLVLGAAQTLRLSADPGLTIPDDDPLGVASTLTVNHQGKLQGIAVRVDISHSWIGDLDLVLVAPDGREAELHGRSGGGADDIQATYTPQNRVVLADWVQAQPPVAGNWTLKVMDRASRDVGTLNHWELELVVG